MRQALSVVFATLAALATSLAACSRCWTEEVLDCPSFDVAKWCHTSAQASGDCLLENTTPLCPGPPYGCDIAGFEFAANPTSTQLFSASISTFAGRRTLELEIIGESTIDGASLSVHFDNVEATPEQEGEGNHFFSRYPVPADAKQVDIRREPTPSPAPRFTMLVKATDPCRMRDETVCG